MTDDRTQTFTEILTHLTSIIGGAIPAKLRAAHEREVESVRRELKLMEHRVITCGVAASHPDANLTRTEAYVEKWDSAQAEKVRELRQRADGVERALSQREAQTWRLAAALLLDFKYAGTEFIRRAAAAEAGKETK